MTDFTTRFAPSPTGLLHLGHAYSALIAFDAACAAGGRFLLRIEDIDETRCRPAFETAIYEDLEWLGLSWEQPVLRQSDHLSDYRQAVDRLAQDGLAYRCFKTRKEIAEAIASAPHEPAAANGPAFVGAPLALDEEAALMDQGAPFAWRLSLKACRDHLGAAYGDLSFQIEEDGARRTVKAEPDRFGDTVIGRKEGGASYHIASVYDDARQNVSHVVRGEDLAEAAHLHVLLQTLLGAPTPVYRHHALITDANGKRLAKRDKAATLQDLRAKGATPADIRKRLDLPVL